MLATLIITSMYLIPESQQTMNYSRDSVDLPHGVDNDLKASVRQLAVQVVLQEVLDGDLFSFGPQMLPLVAVTRYADDQHLCSRWHLF